MSAMISISLSLLAYSWPGSEINAMTFDQLYIGMTKAEVRALIRADEGDHRIGDRAATEVEQELAVSGKGLLSLKRCQQSWVSDFGAIGLDFNEEGKLNTIKFIPVDSSTLIPKERQMQYRLLRLMLCGEK
jgi:hypothetical protein